MSHSVYIFALHVLEQCCSQLYGFTIHLYAIFFTAASCALHIARLYALQKLVGKSLRMSVAKHVKSSFEKAAKVYFV